MSNELQSNASAAGEAQANTIWPSYVVVHGDGGPDGPYVDQTSPTTNPGLALISTVGVGNKYYLYTQDGLNFDWWGGVAVDDWSEAATCTNNVATNNASIAAQLAKPSSKVHAP